jgi:hypothetical protein
MREFKAPDLNAPRFKPSKKKIVSYDFMRKFHIEYPHLKNITSQDVSKIIAMFNTEVWKTAIEHRDGVELPEELGYVFLGRCLPKVKTNTDFIRSKEKEQIVEHKNWDSSDFLLKIFYTNYETKYRFKNHEVWEFQASREFSRTASKAFKDNWTHCIHIDPTLKIAELFRKRAYKNAKSKYDEKTLEQYDEFEL